MHLSLHLFGLSTILLESANKCAVYTEFLFCFFILFLGTTTSLIHYQAYLLEGLVRWNQDRQCNAVAGPGMGLTGTYSGKLQQHVNQLSLEVFEASLLPMFEATPRQYTGKL